MIIDIHCHIMPNIDDGAESLYDAVDIINSASETGTNIMVVTPHYNYPQKCKKILSKSEITEHFKIFQNATKNQQIKTKLFLGAELLANQNITELYNNNELITINKSRYILTEFFFNEDINNVHRYTDQLCSMGLIPIIAHPERYSFLNNQHDIEKLLNKGCKIQLNKDSLLGKYGKIEKETAYMMLRNDYVHFIASDCHNTTSRNSDLGELYIKLLDFFSQQRLNKLFHDNQKRVLLDMDL